LTLYAVNEKHDTMTNWQPDLSRHRGPRYRAIAEALAEDVRIGRLPAGERLPTHRDLAWRLRVTVGTVSRAYAEAERRGLIVGEVGRGTFVRPLSGTLPPGPPEARAVGFVDLTVNRPRARDEAGTMARALESLAGEPDLDALLDYQPHAGRPADRVAAAAWLARSGLAATPEQIVVTASGQHAMACVLAALTQPGETLAVEALTYPGVRAVASLLHLRVVPIAIDEQGLLPDALAAACRAGPVRALYVLPTLHNPTTATMPVERRQAVAEVARQHGMALIEDDVYGFLLEAPPPPLAAFAPELAFHINSTSKSMVPALRTGYVHGPAAQIERVVAAVRATTYSAPPLMTRIASRWIEDGTAARLVEEKRAAMRRRQTLVQHRLAGLTLRTDPAAAHVWLLLPEPWRADDFAAAARHRGVGITPAAAFAPTRQAPNAVRICLGTPAHDADLDRALVIIAELLAAPPEPDLSVV
jgi:DNA-binding transcriptional MocR family regulator